MTNSKGESVAPNQALQQTAALEVASSDAARRRRPMLIAQGQMIDRHRPARGRWLKAPLR